jgi:hypothetical protein
MTSLRRPNRWSRQGNTSTTAATIRTDSDTSSRGVRLHSDVPAASQPVSLRKPNAVATLIGHMAYGKHSASGWKPPSCSPVQELL